MHLLACFDFKLFVKLVIVKNSTCFPIFYLFSTSLFFKHCSFLFAVVFYLSQHTVLVVVVVVVVFSQNSPSTNYQIFFSCWCLFSPCLNCSLVSFALVVQLQQQQQQPRLFPVFSVFGSVFCSVLFCSWFSSVCSCLFFSFSLILALYFLKLVGTAQPTHFPVFCCFCCCTTISFIHSFIRRLLITTEVP